MKKYNEYALVEVRPKTGRQHQIRVHFASINHPIACDKLYGRKAKKCPTGLTRHFLHASGLKFMLKNALMEFESEIPKDLANALKTL
ncbi:MAG: RNA pseudouridine synthase [Bacteroidetes bacterium]|nr:RNA pseudouridine synthase [Bacteroidota bacterium]